MDFAFKILLSIVLFGLSFLFSSIPIFTLMFSGFGVIYLVLLICTIIFGFLSLWSAVNIVFKDRTGKSSGYVGMLWLGYLSPLITIGLMFFLG